MKLLIESIFKVLAVFLFINAIPELSGIYPNTIFSEGKDVQTYQWIFSVTIAPFLVSGFLWFASSCLAEKIVKDDSSVNLTVDSELVSPLTFMFGIYLIVIAGPQLVGACYNIFNGDFPSMVGMYKRASIILSLQFSLGLLFASKPRLLLNLYGRVSR